MAGSNNSRSVEPSVSRSSLSAMQLACGGRHAAREHQRSDGHHGQIARKPAERPRRSARGRIRRGGRGRSDGAADFRRGREGETKATLGRFRHCRSRLSLAAARRPGTEFPAQSSRAVSGSRAKRASPEFIAMTAWACRSRSPTARCSRSFLPCVPRRRTRPLRSLRRLESLLDPIAPNGVITFISSLQQDSAGASVRRLRAWLLRAPSGRPAVRWARSSRRSTAPTTARRHGRSGACGAPRSCSSSRPG